MKRNIPLVVICAFLSVLCSGVATTQAAAPGCDATEPFCYQPSTTRLIEPVKNLFQPTVAVPEWLQGTL